MNSIDKTLEEILDKIGDTDWVHEHGYIYSESKVLAAMKEAYELGWHAGNQANYLIHKEHSRQVREAAFIEGRDKALGWAVNNFHAALLLVKGELPKDLQP
jgi:hypothetical protein